MDTTSNSSASAAAPKLDFLSRIAGSLGVDEAFIEKDWHVTQLLQAVDRLNLSPVILSFSGGTSLSKAHRLIKRFSEDIDFKARIPALAEDQVSQSRARAIRGEFREVFRHGLEAAGFPIDRRRVKVRDEGRCFSIEIDYASVCEASRSLRPYVLIEVTTNAPALEPISRPLQSLVAEARKEAAEVSSMPCVDPVETAADKLSALTWRVPARDAKKGKPYDQALVRHLHDLAALEQIVMDDERFGPLAIKQMGADADRGRNADKRPMDPARLIEDLIQRLTTDSRYATEYSIFVDRMSYARDNERLSFTTALEGLKRLGDAVLTKAKGVDPVEPAAA